MSYQHIKFTIEDGIAHLVLARDDVRNAFSDTAFIDEIVDAVNQAQLGTDTRVLVLSAEGSAFSAGGNVKHMRDKTETFAGGPAAVRRRYIEGIQRIPKALHALDIPSIAAVQGPAIGAGCDLALCRRFVDADDWPGARITEPDALMELAGQIAARPPLASTQARFGETFINVGIIPGDGGAWILPRKVGMQRAAELIFTGRIVDADEAVKIGLALECTEPDALMPRVMELAGQIAARPPPRLDRGRQRRADQHGPNCARDGRRGAVAADHRIRAGRGR